MVSPARILTQVVIVGSQILGRAFVEAYQKAALNAAASKGGARAAAAGGRLGAAASEATRKTGMELDEAALILNVSERAPMEEVLKRYEHLFEVNSPEKGGSFYLQSKVYRAKERIELERQQGGSS